MILIILIFILFIGATLFFVGPDILNSVLAVTDEWREIFRGLNHEPSRAP